MQPTIDAANKRFLQCGRIYKDAEICVFHSNPFVVQYLQCGRIYKDAEIKYLLMDELDRWQPSMWPHL